MALSQNGYTGITQYGDSRLWSNPVIGGTGGVKILGGVLAGDVATVLIWVAEQFHKTVEPLVQSQGVWGYEPRDIRGSTTLSNHASGTAIDLNSARHPLGASGTFTAGQRAAIRALLTACGGVVRWGGDYSGRKDEMHFEIDASPLRVAALAAAISRGLAAGGGTSQPAPAKPAPAPAPAPAPPPAPTGADVLTYLGLT